MFLRSCTSVLQNVVRNNRRTILSRTVYTNGRNSLWATTSSIEESEKTIDRDDPKLKRVNIMFQKVDGTIITKTGIVGESIYDMITADDPEKLEFPGYGACGGTLTCSTCHVIMDEKDFHIPKSKSTDEEDLVCYAPDNCETSRLSCCITITEELEGVIFKLPSAVQNCQDT